MKRSELQQIIKEEMQKVLDESQSPSYKSQHKNNNLVVAIYFSRDKNDNNNSSLWADVIEVIEENDCILINYVVTDSVCEFEFKPNPSVYAGISSDLLNDIKYAVKDSLGTIVSSKVTGYDVYIVGN